VRGSIIGSVVSNMLLVLGLTMVAGGRGDVDRRSLFLQIGIVGVATAAFFIPAVPGWDGDPDRFNLYLITLPVAILLLAVYIAITVYNLRRHHAEHVAAPATGAWSMRKSVLVLGIATVVTALVAEALVGSLEEFGHAAGISEFFLAVVVVAIVGNAAEHGGAIVVARRGKIKLATEIAISSAAQVAVFVAPVVAIFSFLVGPGLPLAIRPVEMFAMVAATAAVALIVLDGRSQRWKGYALVGLYVVLAATFWIAGDR
jgi:Ca2+:H+ antiporter